MTQTRPWIPLFLAGCAWTQVLVAQTGTGFGGAGATGGATGGGTTSPAGGTRGATQGTQNTEPLPGSEESDDPATGTGKKGSKKSGTTSGTQPGTTAPGTTPGGTTKPADPFGFGDPTRPVAPFGAASDQGASTTFGVDPRNASAKPESEDQEAPLQPPAEVPSYTAPSFYGSARQIFTAGQGRFARPKYRYGVSMGIGFDDNINQTPDNAEDIPTQTFEQVIPAEPEVAVFQQRQELTGFRNQRRPGENGTTIVVKVPTFRTVQQKIVLRPAQPEQVVETEIPGIDFGERQSSVVSRLDLNADVQWANPRTVFTMDLRGGAEYYWSRDQNPLEYNGALAFLYLRRISPRVQVSANANFAYQSQPDYSQVNLIDAATAPGSDNSYFAGSAKLDLSYRWSARFSTVTSLSGNTVLYQGDRKSASFWEATIGNEFRYIQSRKTTWVAELRYSQLQYLEGIIGAINTAFVLVGSDWSLSRKFRMTTRLGEALRTFENAGNASTPYGEVSLIYQPDRRNQFSLSGRYGYEQTTNVFDENLVTRFSLAYTRTFNPRLVGSLTGNYVENEITSLGGVNSQTQIYDVGMYFQYMVNRHFSLNARYSYTLSNTSQGTNDYDRGRFFLTGRYDF